MLSVLCLKHDTHLSEAITGILNPGIIPQGNIQMHGIKKLTVFSRRVFSAAQSQLDLSAPTLTQTFRTQVFGDDGQDGKGGVAGPVGRATSHKNYCFSIKNRYVL